MIHIEFLVEERSAEVVLAEVVPKILGADASFSIHPFQGKADLLNNLGSRLRAYRQWMPDEYRIVVLVDRDRDDCRELKERLEREAALAGLSTKRVNGPESTFQILNRIAIEELEAWFLGDPEAMKAAYPRVPRNFNHKSAYRNPDAVTGTWEALERLLKKAKYHRSGLSKITAARDIAIHMDPNRNRSKSFQVFRDGLLSLIE